MKEDTKKEEKEPEQVDAIKTLSSELQKARDDIELLKTIADKKQLSLFYQRNREKLPTIICLRTIGGKVLTGWEMTKNEVYMDNTTKRWFEDQVVKVYYEDGSSEKMSLLDFNRKYVLVKCIRSGIITDEATGTVSFKLVRQDNNKEYTIPDQFVN